MKNYGTSVKWLTSLEVALLLLGGVGCVSVPTQEVSVANCQLHPEEGDQIRTAAVGRDYETFRRLIKTHDVPTCQLALAEASFVCPLLKSQKVKEDARHKLIYEFEFEGVRYFAESFARREASELGWTITRQKNRKPWGLLKDRDGDGFIDLVVFGNGKDSKTYDLGKDVVFKKEFLRHPSFAEKCQGPLAGPEDLLPALLMRPKSPSKTSL